MKRLLALILSVISIAGIASAATAPATASVTMSYSAVGGFPAGTIVANIHVQLVAQNNAANSQDKLVAPQTASVQFTNVGADTYTVVATAVDSSSNILGSSATSSAFTVNAPTVSVIVPVSVTVSVQ